MKYLLYLFIFVVLYSCQKEKTSDVLSLTYKITPVTTLEKHDGKIDIEVNGGVAPYNYYWSTGDTCEDLDSITLGKYSVIVRDFKENSTEEIINVDNRYLKYQPLTLSYNISYISSLIDNDGAIDIIVKGGEEPYTFLWSNGCTTEDLTNLTVGEYKVTVTDFQGQEAIKDIEIGDNYVIYDPPAEISDGWKTVHMNDISNKPELLVSLLKVLRKDNYKIHSVLIAKDGKLLLEKYFPGYDSQGNYIDFNMFTLHEVQSTSKSYRSLLIGIAIDRCFEHVIWN